VDNPFKSPSILSLCTGSRGLEIGLERAIGSVRVAAYVETEAFAVANLVEAMDSGVLAPAPVATCVKTVRGEIFRGKIHGVTGGYPCVGESAAGEMEGVSDDRFLWPHFARIIDAAGPIWGFFENVSNHLNMSFPIVLESLRNMGYRVEAGIFSAAEVGANHIRERVFILAIKDEFLLHAKRARLEGYPWNETERCSEGREGSTGSDHSTSVFPAFRGDRQHDWEVSRIKPRVDLHVHGYDFYEDLLRFSGNGVVPAQAELAFRTLIQKFL
jgi:site-specific DNA-cytosine methylase